MSTQDGGLVFPLTPDGKDIQLDYYRRREKTICECLQKVGHGVCDGGEYVNDIVTAIECLAQENKRLHAENEELRATTELIDDNAWRREIW